ncbi:MAG: FliG C-terminal domain-containing protein [Singulisphaera sp.]
MATPPDILRRAAILVSTLDTESADRLLEQLSPEDAAELRQAILNLDCVDSGEEQAIYSRFLAGDSSQPPAQDTADFVELCLSPAAVAKAYEPEQLPCDRAKVAATVEPGVSNFAHVLDIDLAEFLVAERPQTIAVVLSRLSQERALVVLAALPEDVHYEVLRRWVELDITDAQLVNDIEHELAARIAAHHGTAGRRAAGLAQVAGIVQSADPSLQQRLLSTLAKLDHPTVKELSRPRLAFEDLEYLNAAGLANLVRAVESRTLVLALAGATESFAGRIIEQLPAQEGKRLARAINSLGPTRLVDVEEAQRQLLRAAEKLLHNPDAIDSPLSL